MIPATSHSNSPICVLIRARPPLKLAARSWAARISFSIAVSFGSSPTVANQSERGLATFDHLRFEHFQLLGDGIAVAASHAKLGLGIVLRLQIRISSFLEKAIVSVSHVGVFVRIACAGRLSCALALRNPPLLELCEGSVPFLHGACALEKLPRRGEPVGDVGLGHEPVAADLCCA